MANFVGIVLIQGGESLLADRAVATEISKHPTAECTYLDADEIELGKITDSLAPSLFGEDRVLVIREIQDLASEIQDEISSYLAAPDEAVTLILWHKGGVKGKALVDKIKKCDPAIYLCEPVKKEAEKEQFVAQEFSRLGRKISSAAAADLVSALGNDLRELASACSQLASDVVAGKTIDSAEVARYYQGRIETTGFEVADATLDGKTEVALVALRQALATGVDPVLVISAIASSLRTLAKVSGASRGMKSFDLASSLGLPPWQIDKARRQLAGWNPATLAEAVISIAQADADIKGAAADPGYALERSIIKITTVRAPL
ncbi:MAG: DNA polymerase III subunit delta [Actinomycetes bacterium]